MFVFWSVERLTASFGARKPTLEIESHNALVFLFQLVNRALIFILLKRVKPVGRPQLAIPS